MSSLPIAVLLVVVANLAASVVVADMLSERVGDEVAERTGLGRVFIGALLVAIATSLPELGTDLTATAADAPDLAIGDLFGSSMAILAIVDLRYRGQVLPAVSSATLGSLRSRSA